MKAFDYVAPKTVRETVALLSEYGDRARILAGGTDILVQLREGRRSADLVIDVKGIPELNELRFDSSQGLRIGASVPCYRIYENSQIARLYPGIHDAASLIGGVQIQSRASLGGNLCNASPAADSIPALVAARATCRVAGPEGERTVATEEFCTGPGKTVLGRGEFLVSLHLPVPAAYSGAAYLRFIPRNEMDIAVAGAGVSVTLDADRNHCTAARIALAAVAPTPLFVSEAGEALVDGVISETSIDNASRIAQAAAKPISDMRGDIDYRRHLVGVLTRRSIQQAFRRAKESGT